MIKRKPGRRSAAELGVQISAISVRRPEPPEELLPEEKETWGAVVKTKPADWWRPDTFPLLISYCKHAGQAQRVDRLITGLSDKFVKEADNGVALLDKLLRARDRESRALVNLARAMRLSQQSIILPRGAGRQTVNTPPHESKPPWE